MSITSLRLLAIPIAFMKAIGSGHLTRRADETIVLDVEYVDVDHFQVKQRGIVERPRLDGQAVGVTNFNFK